MAKTGSLSYFLFPHTTVSENHFRNLCIFLPRVSVLEIARQASIPEWAQKSFSGWPVVRSEDLSARIGSRIDGYRTFAQVHGGPGGILGFLSRALDEIDEPRFRIQEQLREKLTPEMDPAQKEIVQAALFLEIARELDEKELEIQSGYARLNAIEEEFRDILGIEDEESERAANISPALAPDTNGLLYMLPRRIESWFRLLSVEPIEGMPVFVACFPEVIEETLEIIRAGCERVGKEFSTDTHLMGSIPGLDGLGAKQFRTLIEAPGMSELLSSCHRDLEGFIRSAAGTEFRIKSGTGSDPGGEKAAELQGKRRLLQNAFEQFCRKCDVPEGNKINLDLTIVENVFLADVPGLSGVSTGSGAGVWPPVFLSISAG